MSNPQVWLPTVVILLSILGTFFKLDALEKHVDDKLNALDKRVDGIATDLRALAAEVHAHTVNYAERIAKLEATRS